MGFGPEMYHESGTPSDKSNASLLNAFFGIILILTVIIIFWEFIGKSVYYHFSPEQKLYHTTIDNREDWEKECDAEYQEGIGEMMVDYP